MGLIEAPSSQAAARQGKDWKEENVEIEMKGAIQLHRY
jgi:hypothetical protein